MAITRLLQARQMRKGGGIMGSNAGSMLVARTADGSRPGYYGPDEGEGGKESDFGKDTYKSGNIDRGGQSGGTDAQFQAARQAVEARNKAAKDAKEKEKQKIIDEMLVTPIGRNKRLNKFQIYNNKFQRQKNLELARKRAFQKYKDLEKYVHGDFDMDYDFTVDIYGNKVPKGLEYLTSNKGTSIESKRKNLYDVNSQAYGTIGIAADLFRPDTQVTLENTLNKARNYNKIILDSPNLTNQQIKDRLTDLQNLGKTPDQINPPDTRDDGNQQAYLPYEQVLPEDDYEREQKEFDYHLGLGGQKVGRDVTLGYAANGGRITRAGGGIMNAVPRQGYFLGKIVKGVKKAVGSVADAAGKVLKSDAGKLALAGAAFYYGGGGSKVFNTGDGFFSGLGKMGANFFSKSNPLLFNKAGELSLGKLGLASAALPFLMPEAKPNEDIGMGERGGKLLDSQGNEVLPVGIRKEINEAYESKDPERIKAIENYYAFLPPTEQYLPYSNYGSQGYRTTVATGGRIRAEEGGLMNLGGMEKDYRAEGGFVPIGKQEKADDVPARLSVNEFVFTADAVRNAGGGDIDKGAEVMENMMKNLENGGRVSEESQGNTGAQEMFSVSERIGEVI